jgi:nicotinamide mononucleotide adenylyltransferase
MSIKKHALFIGRWQNLHGGHLWCFNEKLKEGLPIVIAIRDVEVDENNPRTAGEVKILLDLHFQDFIEIGKVKTMIIPDIEGVYYGRNVGYKVEELIPPQEIAEISGTKIRQQLKEQEDKITNI